MYFNMATTLDLNLLIKLVCSLFLIISSTIFLSLLLPTPLPLPPPLISWERQQHKDKCVYGVDLGWYFEFLFATNSYMTSLAGHTIKDRKVASRLHQPVYS